MRKYEALVCLELEIKQPHPHHRTKITGREKEFVEEPKLHVPI
jgi:hypothetical protein